ncbi:hypothetical protein JCM16303_001330 [Sporobolomyces ruberrimus]
MAQARGILELDARVLGSVDTVYIMDIRSNCSATHHNSSLDLASFSLVYIHWTRRRPGWDQQPQQPHDVGIELPAYSSQPQTAGQQPSRPPPARPPPAHHAPIRYQPEQSDYSDQEGLLANAARPGDSRPRRYSFERDHGVEHPNPTFHPHGRVPGEPESSDAMSSSDDEDDERDERPYHRPSSRTFHI